MGKVLAFLLLIFLSVAGQSQQYSIVDEPVCWTQGAIDSSLTRCTYTSASGGLLSVFYVNAAGATVDVSSGGAFSFGICGCCSDTPPTYGPDIPFIDSLFTSSPTIIIPPPPPPYPIFYRIYAEVENITDSLQVFVCATPNTAGQICQGGSDAFMELTYTYTQVTPTKAGISVDFEIDVYSPDPDYTPTTLTVDVNNGTGLINISTLQFR